MVELSENAEEHREAYGIAKGLIEEKTRKAIERLSNMRETVQAAPWGDLYTLHATELPPGIEGHYLVTIAREEGEERHVVTGAHVVPVDVGLEVREEGHPLKMLKKLANSRYGLPVAVWGNKGPYIYPKRQDAILSAPEGEEDVKVKEEPADGVPAVQQDVMRMGDGTGRVFLAFAVDATAVQETVGE